MIKRYNVEFLYHLHGIVSMTPLGPPNDFFSEDELSPKDLAKILRDLADGFEKGQLVLQKGKNKITMELPNKVRYEIRIDHDPRGRIVIHLHVDYPEDHMTSNEDHSVLVIGGK